MSKVLAAAITDQINRRDIKLTFTFKINSIDYSNFLIDWQVSTSKEFGSASAVFTVDNNDERFSTDGSAAIKVGDVIEFIENYSGDSTNWKRFYGKVNQRSISKGLTNRIITLNCLDYIADVQNWDVDLEIEGTKVEVTDETLAPNYLASPNDMFAQIFNFANDSIASIPMPILMIRDKNHLTDDPQYDGFDIHYDVGQVQFGAPLNALNNYDVIARSYYFYTVGVYCEDVLEELLTTADGYGNYLFDESSAQDVIDNHLTSTYQAENGAATTDVLTANPISTDVTIKTTLSVACTAGTTTVSLASVAGFPTSGEGSVNGDIFTWTGISSNTLTGIPTTGGYALKAHPINSYAKYEETYAAGQVWYLKYSNLVTTLTDADFTIPGATMSYLDKRNGKIILNTAIATSSNVICNTNYTFKTLQKTDVELNRITFRSREVSNRLEAINKLRNYLAPNYIIRTEGNEKIWATYLTQKTNEDYTLTLIRQTSYLEDEDLYTRVVFYAKHKNPTNLMFDESVDFCTTGESYKAYTNTPVVLRFVETVNGWHTYDTPVSNAGYINLDFLMPRVWINNVQIDDTPRQMQMQPVRYEQKTRTETTTVVDEKDGDVSTSVRTYNYYKILFTGHQNLYPEKDINVYDANAVEVLTISANDTHMDYARGIYNAPGNQQNSVIESVSTATYWVMYSTAGLEIDYDNVLFKISNTNIPEPAKVIVTAQFEYITVFTPAQGTAAIMDGRWDTQCQTEFYAQPPSGYNYAILDLGAIKSIQAIDFISGFFKPDEYRKFDTDVRFTLQYSADNVTYYEISDETHNFQLAGGESASFEEDDLGVDFEARYIKVILENVKKVDYKKGVYPVAITEVAMYDDVILKSEAKLIATTVLTQDVSPGDATIYVADTSTFTDPYSSSSSSLSSSSSSLSSSSESSSSASSLSSSTSSSSSSSSSSLSSSSSSYSLSSSSSSSSVSSESSSFSSSSSLSLSATEDMAYIKDSNGNFHVFTYTGLTSTSFTGCTVDAGVSALIGDYVYQTMETDTTLYDNDEILSQLGDRVFKEVRISDETLYTQSQLDDLGKNYLKEFYKNHSKMKVDVLYSPYLKVGQTVAVTDSYNNISSVNYFVESISDRRGFYSLVLARYPA